MQNIPTIKSVMTPFPYWIDSHESIASAIEMMAMHRIQHLPVKNNGKLFGVISERDIKRALANLESGVEKSKKILDVCSPKAYVVAMNEPLDNVLLHMATHHVGSVLVVKGDRLAGVFTSNDACRSYGEFLRHQFRPDDGDDAA